MPHLGKPPLVGEAGWAGGVRHGFGSQGQGQQGSRAWVRGWGGLSKPAVAAQCVRLQ